jgi:hypothetical protein
MNVSNRYLDLGRVVLPIAEDAGLVALERLDTIEGSDDRRAQLADGKAVSRWFLLARSARDLEPLALSAEWRPLHAARARLWTDDYASILGCLR